MRPRQGDDRIDEVVDVIPLREMVARGCIPPRTCIAVHEAGHAVAALFVGITVEWASINLGEADGGGAVMLGEDAITADPVRRLVVKLAGNAAEGYPIAWPPIDTGDTCDESAAATIVRDGDLSREDWDGVYELLAEMAEYPPLLRARKAISAALFERGTIGGDELRAIYSTATSVAREDA